MRSSALFAVLIASTFVASCAHDHGAPASEDGAIAHHSNPPTSRSAEDLYKQMRSLAGSWAGTDQTGAPCNSTFTVSSAGSVIRELMFPGAPHEMTNMIHLDDDALVLTHYCAGGNQPRLKANPGSNPNQIVFELDRVSNLGRVPGHYMGALTITFSDPNSFAAEWTAFEKGEAPSRATFTMSRQVAPKG